MGGGEGRQEVVVEMGCLGKKRFKRNLTRVGVNFPARRNHKCKGPEARACLVCSMSNKETRVGKESGKRRVGQRP